VAVHQTANVFERRKKRNASLDQRRECVVVNGNTVLEHGQVTGHSEEGQMGLEVASDHGVVHEGVAVEEVAEDGASVGEKRCVVGDGCDGEKRSEGIRRVVVVASEDVSV